MQLSNTEIKRYDMISVPFPAGSNATKLVFPDQPQLRGANVHGIDLVFTTRDIKGTVNANYQIGVVPPINISNMFITLYFGGMEGIQNMPLGEIAHITSNNALSAEIVPTNNSGVLALNGQVITWTKSFLTLGQPLPPAVNSVFVVGVYYTLGNFQTKRDAIR